VVKPPRRWPPELLAQRFWAKVDKTPGHGPHGDCWLFTGPAFTGTNGVERYGCFFDGAKNRQAHRVAYELQFGLIPRGELVRHGCHVKRCVRHLLLGTHEDNVADQVQRNRDEQETVQPSLLSAGPA